MDGLLGSLFSKADTIKRNVYGLLSDPRSWGASLVQDLQSQNDQVSRDYRTLFEGGVMTSPQERQAAMSRAMEQSTGLLGPTVYHGSPHSFTKFDSSKIGTGEGAQAYGHGLYLAENPDVASSYAPASRTWAQIKNGPPAARGTLYKVDLPDEHIAKMLDWDKPLSQQPKVKEMLEKKGFLFEGTKSKPVDASMWKWDQSSGNTIPSISLTDAGRAAAFRRGSGFAVDGELLSSFERLYGSGDVGLPLSEVSKNVLFSHPWVKVEGNRLRLNDIGRESVKRGLEEQSALLNRARSAHGWNLGDITGSNLHSTLTESIRNLDPRIGNFGDDVGASGSMATSKFLNELGIPGIRYLDQGSRGTGTGTSNYVVFPGGEDMLTILERNGQGLLGR